MNNIMDNYLEFAIKTKFEYFNYISNQTSIKR